MEFVEILVNRLIRNFEVSGVLQEGGVGRCTSRCCAIVSGGQLSSCFASVVGCLGYGRLACSRPMSQEAIF